MQCNKKHIVLGLFLLGCQMGYAQQPTDLKGRVYSKDGDVAATHVLNTTTNRAAITDANGFFNISVRINDILVFSAIQFKKKQIVITSEVVESDLFHVFLEDAEIALDEVVVMPYNLTGDLDRDVGHMEIGQIVTASTLGLPNANVKVKTQNERKLFEADNGKFVHVGFDSASFDPVVYVNLNKILNRITGRTRILKKRLALEREYNQVNRVKKFYADSLYVQDLKIPEDEIDKFIYFCEVDSLFESMIDANDKLKIWEFMRKKSRVYRKNNGLD